MKTGNKLEEAEKRNRREDVPAGCAAKFMLELHNSARAEVSHTHFDQR